MIPRRLSTSSAPVKRGDPLIARPLLRNAPNNGAAPQAPNNGAAPQAPNRRQQLAIGPPPANVAAPNPAPQAQAPNQPAAQNQNQQNLQAQPQ